MIDAGLTVAKVAKRLSVRKDTVKAAETAAKSSAAMQALDGGQISLVEAAALTEFEDIPGAVERLMEVIVVAANRDPLTVAGHGEGVVVAVEVQNAAAIARERVPLMVVADVETSARVHDQAVMGRVPRVRQRVPQTGPDAERKYRNYVHGTDDVHESVPRPPRSHQPGCQASRAGPVTRQLVGRTEAGRAGASRTEAGRAEASRTRAGRAARPGLRPSRKAQAARVGPRPGLTTRAATPG
jgi:hypothetical protein